MSYPVKEPEYGTYLWLAGQLGGVLFGKHNEAELDHEQREKVKSIIQSGYMQMLFPPPLAAPREGAPAPKPHQWSFLTPLASLGLEAGRATYELPDNFSGVLGEFTTAS